MDNKDIYSEQQKISSFEFVLEMPNFIAVAVTAILTRSLIAWMDFVDSLGNVIGSGFIVLMSKKLKRNLKYEYNYGIGKIEAIGSLCSELIVISGLISVSIFSVMELIEPKRPSDLLFLAVLLKVVNVAFDAYFFARQRKLSKSAGRIVRTEYKAMVQAFVFDSIALISLFVCYAFRDVHAVWYLSPIVCLAVSVYFFVGGVPRIRGAIFELTDKTLSEDEQLIIIKALNTCYEDYAKLISANSHMSGGRFYIDLNVSFEKGTNYGEIQAFLHKVTEKIHTEIPGSIVQIVISE